MLKLLSIARFVSNNIKYISITYIAYKLNYGFYLESSYKNDINPYLQSKLVKKLAAKLGQLIMIY